MLRYLWAVVAVLVVLIASGTGVGQRGAGASEPYDSEEVRFLHLINDYREQNGVGPLLLSDALSVAAEHHSRDMASYGFFAHDTLESSYYPAGSAPWDRMRTEGYDYNVLMGENIAVGCESAERCFELWRNSPAHNAAMLDGSYRVMGIGRLYDENSVHGWYWTTDFGGARVDPTFYALGESTSAARANEPLKDGPAIENGEISSREVWKQKTKDRAQLILTEGGYARLGDYDKGRDELWQKIRIEENSELSYRIKIETTEVRHPSDYLAVQLKDKQGERLAIVKRHTDEDAGGGWRRVSVDLTRFAGKTVYLSFLMETDEQLTTAFYLDDVALEENGE